MEQLSRHSAATAHLARFLARRTAMVSEHAFLCGLLHDVGSVAALVTLAAMPTRSSPVPPLAQVWSAVTDVHELASEIVCVSWKLPEDVAPVVARHHNPVVGGRFDPVAGIVTIADFLATELGYGVDGDVLPIPPPALLQAVGLDNTNIERLVDDCTGVIPTGT